MVDGPANMTYMFDGNSYSCCNIDDVMRLMPFLGRGFSRQSKRSEFLLCL